MLKLEFLKVRTFFERGIFERTEVFEKTRNFVLKLEFFRTGNFGKIRKI